MFEEFAMFDVLRAGIVLIGLVLAFLADKKGEIRIWQFADAAFHGLYGFGAYFFPELLLRSMTIGELDIYHIHLYQCFGGSFLALSIVTLIQSRSNDPKVNRAWLLTRAVGPIFMFTSDIVTLLTGATSSQRMSDKDLLFGAMTVGLVWLGSVFKLWQHHRSDRGVSSVSRGRTTCVLNQHLLFSIVLTLPEVVMCYAMSGFAIENFLTKKYDIIHIHMLRSFFVPLLIFVLQEMSALEYEKESDKRDLLIGRIAFYLLMLPLVVMYQYQYSLFSSAVFYGQLLSIAGLLGNCGCAVFLRLKEKAN